jgi:hypothetical protein
MERTAEELALQAQIDANPVLKRLYDAAKRLAMIQLQRAMWANTSWALTPGAPRPTLPPLPWHENPSDRPEIAAVQLKAEEDARREVSDDMSM